MAFKPIQQKCLTIIIATIGVVIFKWLETPLPFLFGPLFACLIAALLKAPLGSLKKFSIASRTVLGVAVGSTMTLDFFSQLPTLGFSILLVPIFSLMIGLIGTVFFIRFCKFDRVSAYYASMPGGFQDMVSFGIEAGGNARIISLVHATRVLIIITLIPLVLVHFYQLDLSNPVGLPAREVSTENLIFLLIAAFFGWLIAKKIGIFGAPILGPLILAAIFALLGLIDTRPPREAILLAQFFIGAGIGFHYLGVSLAEIKKVITGAIVYTLIILLLACSFAGIAYFFSSAPQSDAFLAFVPGGQAEITVFAIISDSNLIYVISHHIVRLFSVILLSNLVFKLLDYWLKPKD